MYRSCTVKEPWHRSDCQKGAGALSTGELTTGHALHLATAVCVSNSFVLNRQTYRLSQQVGLCACEGCRKTGGMAVCKPLGLL